MSHSEMTGVLCVPMYRVLAQAFVEMGTCCEEENRPLTDLQKITILACIIQSTDGLQDTLEGNVRVSELLREIAEGV